MDDLAGMVIETGARVMPSGRPGIPGGLGPPSWAAVLENFEVPAIGEDVVIEVDHAGWPTVDAYVVIGEMIGQVIAVDGLAVTVRRVVSPQGQIGSRGPQGIQGIQGETGPSAYAVAVKEGFDGTVEEWLESLVGPQGPAAEAGATVTVAEIPPEEPAPGDLWFDSVSGQLFVQFEGAWVVANVSPAGQQPMGVTDGSDAMPGQVGEFIQAIEPNLIGYVNLNWILGVAINLTPGDWDVQAMAYTIGTPSNFAIMQSTGTSPGAGWPPVSNPFAGAQLNGTGFSNNTLWTGTVRWSFTVATTVYLHWLCQVGSATQAYAALRARRMR